MSYSSFIGFPYMMLQDFKNRTNVRNFYKFLRKSQWWTREEVEKYQNQRLQALIKHAYYNVPYYRRIFDERNLLPTDIQSKEDLKLLPFLTKKIIRDNFVELTSKDSKWRGTCLSSTGGSTGEPLRYLIGRVDKSISLASKYRGLGFAGYRYGDKIVILGGSSLIPWQETKLKSKISKKVQRKLLLAAVHMDEEIMNKYVKQINGFRPSFIRGYPSSIYVLANFIKKYSKLEYFPDAIITTAEMLLPKYRRIIEDVFNCHVFNEYGCNDGGLLAFECEEHSGLHYSAEKVILEVIYPKGSTYQEGVGEVVLTDLFNFSMVFIRYKNGDLAKLSKWDCPCGRGLPLIESIEGRTSDIITFRNGITLGSPALTLIFKDFNFDNYQVIQENASNLKIKAVKGIDFESGEEQLLIKIFKEHIGKEVEIELEFVDEIPTIMAGKRKFIISNL